MITMSGWLYLDSMYPCLKKNLDYKRRSKMELSVYLKKVVQNFFIIFASIILTLTILRQIYSPEIPFDLHSIYIIMIFSLIGALTGFILYSPHTLSEQKTRIRLIIHFFALETILILLAIRIGLVNGLSDVLILALEIAVIYIVVRLLSWHNDKKIAKEINEGLKTFKDKMENGF
ncbi:DUF3021 domain-containing protein [Lysinibacillus sp. BW-2-10]|nr:DUF3021 domain-containing protein [Lysinibacillus sp. BW-2-10]